jgi:uridine kinase
VAGGSGSGKTYFAQALQYALGKASCEIVYQDNFYFDQSAKFDFDGGQVNFDHPSSIDFGSLAAALKILASGQATQIPIYDFDTHKRRAETLTVEARKVIIVDGILIFHEAGVRALFDDLVFFDTPEDLRFRRRLKRDVELRGRTEEGVRNQFLKQVKPMHEQFVEPSKVHARTIVTETGEFDEVLRLYRTKLG